MKYVIMKYFRSLIIKLFKTPEADCGRGEFTVMWKAQMAASGTGKCLAWLYPVLLLLLAAQTSTLWIVLHFSH